MQNFTFNNKEQIKEDLNSISINLIKEIDRNNKLPGITVNQLSDSSKMRKWNRKKYFTIVRKN